MGDATDATGADVASCSPRRRGWVTLPAVVGVLVAAVCLAGYLDLAGMKTSPLVFAFDTRVSALVQAWRTPPLTVFFVAITWGASAVPVTLVTVAAIAVLVWLARYREALFVAVVMSVGTGLGAIAKLVAVRPRPPVATALIELPTSYSFPSGHALAGLLLWTVIIFAVWRTTMVAGVRWATVAVGLPLAVLSGLSRVYLGVHWPSDVLASWLLGGAWLALCLGVFFTWERAMGPEPC